MPYGKYKGKVDILSCLYVKKVLIRSKLYLQTVTRKNYQQSKFDNLKNLMLKKLSKSKSKLVVEEKRKTKKN